MKIVILFIILLIIAVNSAAAEFILYEAENLNDARIYNNRDEIQRNFGSCQDLYIKCKAEEQIARTYIMFDISRIPNNANIVEAFFYWFTEGSNEGRYVDVHHVTAYDWNEGTLCNVDTTGNPDYTEAITWYNQPCGNGNCGAGSSTECFVNNENCNLTLMDRRPQDNGWIEFNVLPAVRRAYNEGKNNVSFVFKDSDEEIPNWSSGGYAPYSKENEYLNPALIILFESDLRERLLNLEEKVDDLENRASLLEQWKTTIQNTINAIETQLETVKQWLFFWNYQGQDETICDAIENECGEKPDIECYNDDWCSQDSFVGDNYCLDNDVYRDYRNYFCINPGTSQSYCHYEDLPTQIEDCEEECRDGVCITIIYRNVIFRTNVEDGNYKGSGKWIALDKDGDDNLEGYMYDTYFKSWARRKEEKIGETVEGYEIYPYGNNIIINRDDNPIYEPSTDPSIELSSVPTEPYASNGQEVYE